MRGPGLVATGELFHWAAIFAQPKAAFGVFGRADTLETGDGELGRRIRGLGYVPSVVVRYFDVDVVYPPTP